MSIYSHLKRRKQYPEMWEVWYLISENKEFKGLVIECNNYMVKFIVLNHHNDNYLLTTSINSFFNYHVNFSEILIVNFFDYNCYFMFKLVDEDINYIKQHIV